MRTKTASIQGWHEVWVEVGIILWSEIYEVEGQMPVGRAPDRLYHQLLSHRIFVGCLDFQSVTRKDVLFAQILDHQDLVTYSNCPGRGY